MAQLTSEILLAAIEGFEFQKRRIDDQIRELRAMLSGGSTKSAVTPDSGTPKRKVSAEARRRMALGQQKRWAGIKQGTPSPAASPEQAEPKRRLSEAGKAAIVAALKKRWAAKRAGDKTAPGAVTKASAKKSPAKKSPAKKGTKSSE